MKVRSWRGGVALLAVAVAALAPPWPPPSVVLANPAAAIVVPSSPAVQYWYFCEASRTYYPYVATCPGGWRQVQATPADASPVVR